jgi:hypothetical protein
MTGIPTEPGGEVVQPDNPGPEKADAFTTPFLAFDLSAEIAKLQEEKR